MTQYVHELNNVEILTLRHKEQLTNEGFLTDSEVEGMIQNNFLNSKVQDIEYLFKDLNVSVVGGVVFDGAN